VSLGANYYDFDCNDVLDKANHLPGYYKLDNEDSSTVAIPASGRSRYDLKTKTCGSSNSGTEDLVGIKMHGTLEDRETPYKILNDDF